MARLPGRPTIPPRVRGIAMTDRENGDVWLLMADTDAKRIKLLKPPPGRFQGRVHAADGGPRVPSPHGSLRLLIRDGRLGYDRPVPQVSTKRALAVSKVRSNPLTDTVYEVLFSDSTKCDGALSFEREVVL